MSFLFSMMGRKEFLVRSGGVSLRPSDRNRGGVGIAKAGGFGFLEAGERARRHRKRGMHGASKLHGGREVLFRGADAKRGFAARGSAQSPCNHGATPLHRG